MKWRIPVIPVAILALASCLAPSAGNDRTPTQSQTPPKVASESATGCSAGENTASGKSVMDSDGNSDSAFITDADPDTAWQTGASGQGWVEIDLGVVADVRCVRLRIKQTDPGPARIRVNGGVHDNPGAVRGHVKPSGVDGEWLEMEGPWEFQFLRITIESGPPNIGLYEIEVR